MRVKPLLSICIATLNRAEYIGDTLDTIIAQATDEIEIVVVDGASTDNTEAVVRARMEDFAALRYVKLSQKGGVDADYDRTVEEASGEYCWLFSDDDLLKPGAISAVLKAVEARHELIIVNAEARSADMAELLKPKVMSVDGDQIFLSSELQNLFSVAAQFLTFIGCVVIRRGLWMSRERRKYYGSAFIHVGVIFQDVLPGTALVMAQAWIVIRYGNASWTNRAFDIWMLQWPRLIWSFDHIPVPAKRRITRREPFRSSVVMFLSRAVDGYSMDIYHQRYAPLLRNRRERIIAQVIARTPGLLINTAAQIMFRVFRPHDLLMMENFRKSRFSLHRLLRSKQ